MIVLMHSLHNLNKTITYGEVMSVRPSVNLLTFLLQNYLMDFKEVGLLEVSISPI